MRKEAPGLARKTGCSLYSMTLSHHSRQRREQKEGRRGNLLPRRNPEIERGGALGGKSSTRRFRSQKSPTIKKEMHQNDSTDERRDHGGLVIFLL